MQGKYKLVAKLDGQTATRSFFAENDLDATITGASKMLDLAAPGAADRDIWAYGSIDLLYPGGRVLHHAEAKERSDD